MEKKNSYEQKYNNSFTDSQYRELKISEKGKIKNQTNINLKNSVDKNIAHSVIYVILIVFVFSITAVSTYVGGAWFFKRQSVKDNDLSFGSVEVVAHNLPQLSTYQNQHHIDCSVVFENIGSLEVVIRAISCVEWDNGQPMEELLEVGQDWTIKDDGYYYYNKTLKSGETSSVFLTGVTFQNSRKQGRYKIPVYVESVQVKNGVYKDLFRTEEHYE